MEKVDATSKKKSFLRPRCKMAVKNIAYLGLIISYTKQRGQTIYKIASELQTFASLKN